MHATNKKNASQQRRRGAKRENQRILYDARGVRIPDKSFSNSVKRTLLFYVLPYVVINAVIFILVTSSPKIDLKVNETNDYRSTKVEFTVKSILPVKELHVSLESADVPYEKAGKTYTAELTQNGMIYIEAVSQNGMKTAAYADVNVLDETAPSIDADTCTIAGGDLTFVITDSQSGVNFDSIYGIYDGNKQVKPTHIDKSTGTVTIPMYTDSIELHFEDMVGNARSGNISASSSYSDGNAEDSEDGNTGATLAAESESKETERAE